MFQGGHPVISMLHVGSWDSGGSLKATTFVTSDRRRPENVNRREPSCIHTVHRLTYLLCACFCRKAVFLGLIDRSNGGTDGRRWPALVGFVEKPKRPSPSSSILTHTTTIHCG